MLYQGMFLHLIFPERIIASCSWSWIVPLWTSILVKILRWQLNCLREQFFHISDFLLSRLSSKPSVTSWSLPMYANSRDERLIIRLGRYRSYSKRQPSTWGQMATVCDLTYQLLIEVDMGCSFPKRIGSKMVLFIIVVLFSFFNVKHGFASFLFPYSSWLR